MEALYQFVPVLAAAAIFLINITRWMVTKSQLGLDAQRIAALQKEITRLRSEAEKLNNPSTYVQCAKLQRTANNKEKALVELTNIAKRAQPNRLEQAALGMKVAISLMAVLLFWDRPVAAAVQDHIWPMGKMLSFPHSKSFQPLGLVAIIPWLTLCDRVSTMLARVLLPVHVPAAAAAHIKVA